MRLGIKVGMDTDSEVIRHDQVAPYDGCPVWERRNPLVILMIVKTA
jgi:hypothetical protein